jgi:UDP-galactose transporter B1
MAKSHTSRFSRVRSYVKVSFEWFPMEVRFIASVLGLYVSFVYWGYLQEKITSTKYTVDMVDPDNKVVGTAQLGWDYSLALNLCMAISAVIGAAILERLTGTFRPESIWLFWEMAITCSLASPIGYFSLKFIPYPLMVLAKSSKQVPVMFMGIFVFKQKYPWYKYLSVFLVCGGVAMFTLCKPEAQSDDDHHGNSGKNEYSYLPEKFRLLIGIILILTNLLLDGYTNNKQDYVFNHSGVSSLAMMKYLNLWQAIFLLLSLMAPCLYYGVGSHRSELEKALYMLQHCSEVRMDILWFALCATTGQVLIFVVMQEFGSLVWITVGVTRKLITIIMSIVIFKHHVNLYQWAGIFGVFLGLIIESAMSYMLKEQKKEQLEKLNQVKGVDNDKRDTSATRRVSVQADGSAVVAENSSLTGSMSSNRGSLTKRKADKVAGASTESAKTK